MRNATKTNFHLIRVFGRFSKGMQTPIFQHIRSHGLTENQFMVLEMLYSKGELRMNDIVERSFSTDGNMGVVIKNLMKQGLVEKRVDDEDKRIRRISLTKKGNDVIGDYFPRHEEFMNSFFRQVETTDKEALIDLLKKIGKQLSLNERK
jgi:DNA-binding MarR family transcriptional regulator